MVYSKGKPFAVPSHYFGTPPAKMGSSNQEPETGSSKVPTTATAAVLKPSEPVATGSKTVKGIDFNDFKGRDVTVVELLKHMDVMGFQAMNLAKAIQIIDEMVRSLVAFAASHTRHFNTP